MADERLEVEIVLQTKSIKKDFGEVEKRGKKAGKTIEGSFTGAFKKIQSSIGGLLVALTSLRILSSTISNFSEFEKQLVAVGKTTEISGNSLTLLGEQIREISKDIPVGTNNLLKFAETAGQFGVQGSESILAFAETLAKLELATNVVGEEGAKSLARILSVTRESTKTVGRLGAVITDLGNNFAASESEILDVATEVAKITAIFGASSAQAAGLGAALKQSGVEAEAGGTAIGKTFILISKAISDGGLQLERFARVSGKTAEELRDDFAKNSVEAFKDLIKGLSDIQKGGGNVSKSLQRLGLNNVRVTKSLLPLIKNYSVLETALRRANIQSQEATALNIEAARAADTLAGDLTILVTSLTNFSTRVGKLFSPALRTASKLVTSLVDSFSDLSTILTADVEGDIARLRFELGGITDDIDLLNERIKVQDELPEGVFGVQKFVRNLFGSPEERKKELEARAKEIVDEIRLLQGQILTKANQDPSGGGEGTITETLVARNGTLAEALSTTFSIFEESITNLFDTFSEKLFNVVTLTEEQTAKINELITKTFVKGIVSGVQTFVKALAAGENAFEALGKNILGLLGDLAIQIGTFLIATGIGQLEVLTAPGGPVIAAGIGLVALGTLLKTIGGSGFGGTAGGGAGGGAGFIPDENIEVPEDDDFQRGTQVTVNVEGTILDPVGTATQIAELLTEITDSNDITVNA